MLNDIAMLATIYWKQQQQTEKLSTIILIANVNGKAQGWANFFSRRAALTIQELAESRIDHSKVAEGQCLKSSNSCIQCKSLH